MSFRKHTNTYLNNLLPHQDSNEEPACSASPRLRVSASVPTPQFKVDRLLSCLAVFFTVFFAVFFSLSEPLFGQSNEKKSQANPIQFMRPSDRADPRGTPPTNHGAGSRGECPETRIPLTRLVGSKDLDLTIRAYPTIWVYIPYTSAQTQSGQFNFYLQEHDGEENTLYQISLSLPPQPGIIPIELPPSQVNPLAINEKYRWYVTVDCSRNASDWDSNLALVTGQVRRIPLTAKLKKQLESKTLLERVRLYAENGIWYDTLTELAQLQINEPKLVRIWKDLLTNVGLEKISQEPILEYYSSRSKDLGRVLKSSAIIENIVVE